MLAQNSSMYWLYQDLHKHTQTNPALNFLPLAFPILLFNLNNRIRMEIENYIV